MARNIHYLADSDPLLLQRAGVAGWVSDMKLFMQLLINSKKCASESPRKGDYYVWEKDREVIKIGI